MRSSIRWKLASSDPQVATHRHHGERVDLRVKHAVMPTRFFMDNAIVHRLQHRRTEEGRTCEVKRQGVDGENHRAATRTSLPRTTLAKSAKDEANIYFIVVAVVCCLFVVVAV
jgi:hypothetical protein